MMGRMRRQQRTGNGGGWGRWARWVLVALGAGLAGGCVEVMEEVAWTGRGDGYVRLVCNLQGMAPVLESYLDNDGAEGEGPRLAIEDDLDRAAVRLQGMAGISEVRREDDRSVFRFGLSFRFETVRALNQGLEVFWTDVEARETKGVVYHEALANGWRRTGAEGLTAAVRRVLAREGRGRDLETLDKEALLGDVGLMARLRAPGRIERVSNPDSVLAADRRSVGVTLFPFRGHRKGGPLPTVENRVEVAPAPAVGAGGG